MISVVENSHNKQDGRGSLTRDISAHGAVFENHISPEIMADQNAGAVAAPNESALKHESSFGDGSAEKKKKEDPTEKAIEFVRNTLQKYSFDNRGNEIVEHYEDCNTMIQHLDTLHSAIIQKHEADFVLGYKDHMVRIQQELADFKMKSSEFYLNMKKSEKIRMLENSITFFREECIKMARMIDKFKKRCSKLDNQLKFSRSETETWHDEAKTLKFQNVILKHTIDDLKSPHLIAKYEEYGRMQAEKEFKKLLAQRNAHQTIVT